MDSIFSIIGWFGGWDVKSFLLFTVIFILTADYLKNRRTASYPPGPPTLPIVGNLLTVDKSRVHESMTQLAEKYGDVYSLRLGTEWVVVLNGFKVVKEALVNHAETFAYRPPLPLFYLITEGKGTILTNGHMWRQQRRFALSTLRYFGLGKKSLEPVILDEITYCSQEFRSYKGKPFNPRLILTNAISNIICSLVFGRRFEYHDVKFRTLIEWFSDVFQVQGSIWAQLYNSFPRLFGRMPGPIHTIPRVWKQVKDFIRVELQEHKKKWDPSDPRDYIDCYLNDIQTHKNEADSTFDEENLIVSAFELFVAGSETTSTTLNWGLLFMAKYPEIQAKVQDEIDRVIGQSRPPAMEDRVNLPYTDAVIHEIQRMGNIVPLNVHHMNNKDVQMLGYTIPKGSTIIPNLTSVLFDKNEWETPYTFNPGHFLNEQGKFEKKAAFMPFSAGKRMCLGENLARMELFLFFTCFMQHFTFSAPAGVNLSLDYLFGSTLSPRPYEILATSR